MLHDCFEPESEQRISTSQWLQQSEDTFDVQDKSGLLGRLSLICRFKTDDTTLEWFRKQHRHGMYLKIVNAKHVETQTSGNLALCRAQRFRLLVLRSHNNFHHTHSTRPRPIRQNTNIEALRGASFPCRQQTDRTHSRLQEHALDRALPALVGPQRASASKQAFPLRPLCSRELPPRARGTPEWVAVADGGPAGIQRRSTLLADGARKPFVS